MTEPHNYLPDVDQPGACALADCGLPRTHAMHDVDDAPTLVRLPLLPSPDQLDELREERRRLEDHLMRAVHGALDQLREARLAMGKARDGIDQAVAHARAAGATWSEIARTLGMSRQAVTKRWESRL